MRAKTMAPRRPRGRLATTCLGLSLLLTVAPTALAKPGGKPATPATAKPATPAASKPGKPAAAKPAASAKAPRTWDRDVLRLGASALVSQDAAPMVVAVLDTGLALDASGTACVAPGLEALDVLPGWDFVDGDAFPDDDNGHGTLMASLVAAGELAPGLTVGAAPGVTILPIKVLGHDRRGTEAALTQGIAFATAAGADVISMSLAFGEGFVPTRALAQAIAEAEAAGVVLVAAAGNHGAGELAYPAAFGPVIAAGAAELTRPHPVSNEMAAPHKVERAPYSAFGAGLDVLAPGGDLGRDLNFDGFPDGVLALGVDGPELISGTSASAALTAGLAARLLAAGADPEEVRGLLQVAAVPTEGHGFHTVTGAGVATLLEGLVRVATGAVPTPPQRFVNPVGSLVEGPDGRRAVVVVEVVDEAMAPVAGVEVLGHVRGAVRHDLRAVTDAQGRALFVTRPAPGGALFEVGVDFVVEQVATPAGPPARVAHPPRAFARFDLPSLELLASLGAGSGGTGLEPSPFVLYLPWLMLRPYALAIAATSPTQPSSWTATAPVEGAPADLADLAPIESLMARTFAGPLTSAPTLVILDRALLADCGVAAEVAPMAAGGTGLEPSPFRLSLLAYEPTYVLQPVVVRSYSTGTQLVHPDGTTADLSLMADGTAAIVRLGASEGCPGTPALLTRAELLPPTLALQGAAHAQAALTFEVLALEGAPGFDAVASALTGAAAVDSAASLGHASLAAWAQTPLSTGAAALMLGATWAQLPLPAPGAP